MRLDGKALDAGTQLVALDSVGSTSTEAFAAARSGALAPLWVVAAEQTAGRGRRGRTWQSMRGNLYASLLLIAPSPPQVAAQLSFVAALALHDAACAMAPGAAARLRLKWPNDVLLAGDKVAGILVEGEDVAGCGHAVVIGCGVNCRHHPADTPYPAGDFSDYNVTRESFFAALSGAMVDRITQWNAGAGFAAIRSAWLARAAGIGMPVRVRTMEREVDGQFDTIDAQGGLVLALPSGGREIISAGEVILGQRPSYGAAV